MLCDTLFHSMCNGKGKSTFYFTILRFYDSYSNSGIIHSTLEILYKFTLLLKYNKDLELLFKYCILTLLLNYTLNSKYLHFEVQT